MADLGELLGTLVVGLAHARRMADEESANIAERYRDNPLLERMSVPRIRVQELRVDVPVLLDTFDAGAPSTPGNPTEIGKALRGELKARLAEHKINLTPELADRFDAELQRGLASVATPPEPGPVRPEARSTAKPVTREAFARIAESAFLRGLGDDQNSRERLAPEVTLDILEALRKRARELGVASSGRPPRIGATLFTNDIKDRGTPDTVTRLSLVLREEGLEWSEVSTADGRKRRVLGPE